MKFSDRMSIGLLLIMIGAALQNISWYVRLQKTELLREFEMMWASDGARVFLDFNIINYFFISAIVVMIVIFKLLDYRSSSVNKTSEVKNERK